VNADARPVLVAFDGSPGSQAAVREAAGLFPDRRLVVVSVWEPGLRMLMMSRPDALGFSAPPPSPEEIATIDRVAREHATATAEAGAQLARGRGAIVEAVPVPDEVDVAHAIAATAEQQDAAAIVVGSRGLGAVRSRVLGSTSRKLLHDSRRPVLVVRTAAD
jgi:nucleotide-binding universal stress UspA family protein